MKKLSLALSSASAATFLFASRVFAQVTDSVNPCQPNADGVKPDYCINPEIGPVIGFVIQFIFVVAVILALGFLVYGGIKWITSGGDKDGVASARGTIIAAIIGLIVVFLAYVILNLVLVFLTGAGIGDLSVPTLT